MDSPFLQLKNVTKAYDQHLAVDSVSLSIPKGKIYGLLGPNGAGKTSIIRMITGITGIDKGQILFDGAPLEPRHAVDTGYMPEERGLYKKMKVREQITYLLALKGLSMSKAQAAADEWLDRLGLSEWRNRNTTDLSKGMQQKVQFISTIAHRPRLLILDEPFSGLDPVNAKLIESEILKLKADGTTIIFSTHRMEQVEELCDYIALINKGQVMLEDDITTVRKNFQKSVYQLDFVGDKAVLDQLKVLKVLESTDKSAKVEITPGFSSRDMLIALAQSPLEILTFQLHLPRLNEIFIELISSEGTHVAQRSVA